KDTIPGATLVGGTFIDTNGVGYTKVIDGTITIPSGLAEINIDVPAGGPGTSPYTPTPGNAVLYIVVYKTTSAVSGLDAGAFPPRVFCNSVGGSQLVYQSTTLPGSIGTANAFRPETRFGGGQLIDIAAVTNIYSLGKVPTPWGCPDTICYRVKRIVSDPNPFFMRIRIINRNPFPGTTKWDTNFVFNHYDPNPFDTLFTFNRPWNYTGWKKDSIIIEIQPLAGEDVIANNRLSYNSMVTCDAWNWAEDDKPNDGGVGLNSAGNFVACFWNRCPTPVPLWAVDLNFNSQFTGSQQYHVKVYSDNNGQPGPVVYNSPIYLSPPIGPPFNVSVQQLLPNILVPANSRFYIGITQLAITNIGYSYQAEAPVKTGRFFYSTEAAGVGPWTDFGNAGANFRLDICPRTISRVNLSAYLEGFYNGVTMVADTAQLFARASGSPYQVVDIAKNTVASNGMSWFEFCQVQCNVPYYFEFRHRNHIKTWTSQALVYDCELPYDFTNNITKAFGNNMVFVPLDASNDGAGGGYAFFTSDVNQDDVVDLADCSDIENDAFNFVNGYVVTDVNGDLVVDLTDLAYCDNNAGNFVTVIQP
ncbi:MAG: hypothetical protein WAT71_15205, partial [Ignavibacteria bacterium]